MPLKYQSPFKATNLHALGVPEQCCLLNTYCLLSLSQYLTIQIHINMSSNATHKSWCQLVGPLVGQLVCNAFTPRCFLGHYYLFPADRDFAAIMAYIQGTLVLSRNAIIVSAKISHFFMTWKRMNISDQYVALGYDIFRSIFFFWIWIFFSNHCSFLPILAALKSMPRCAGRKMGRTVLFSSCFVQFLNVVLSNDFFQ